MALQSESIKVENSLLSSVISPFEKFVQSSGRNVLKQALTFSSYSNNSFSGTFYPPSSSTLIDKRVLLEATVAVISTDGDDLAKGSLRAFPLASVMSSLTVGINGNNTTSIPRDLVYYKQRIHADSLFRSKWWSMSPCCSDPASTYGKCPEFVWRQSETTITGGTPVANSFTRLYVPWSPFLTENPFFKNDNEVSRASFPTLASSTNTSFNYNLTEPLIHPLFCDDEEAAITNVRELSINITFDTVLNRIWSSPVALAGVQSVNMVLAPPRLHITFHEPEDASQIPLSVSLPYAQDVIKNFPIGSVLGTANPTFTASNIVLGQVPSKIVAFIRPRNSELVPTVADGFCAIDQVNITLGNRSGILSSASAQQLYQMSVSNGVDMNWVEWSRKIGSIVVIDVSKDIGGLQPGALGNVSLSMDVRFRNTLYNDFATDSTGNVFTGNFDLYVICELQGEYRIAQDSANLSLGLSVADMMEADQGEALDVSGVKAEVGSGMYGGSMRGFRRFVRGLKRGLRSVNRFVQKVASAPGLESNPYLQGAASILGSTNNMLNPPRDTTMPVAQAVKVEGGRMYGRGMLRL